MDMAINPGLGYRCRIGAHKARITVGQIQREEMRLLLDTADHHHRFTKICLRVTGGMRQRDKHLTTAAPVFPDIVLDRRIAALELVHVPQPFKNALGRVALFARTVNVTTPFLG